MTEVTPLLLSATGKTAASAAAAISVVSLLLTAASLSIALGKVTFSWREKLIHRELEILEQGTGVLRITGALFVRHTKIICGHQQLDIPFQLDDAELTQGYIKLTAFVSDHQIIIKAAADVGRYVCDGSIAAAGIQHLAAQHHGIHHLHNRHRQVGSFQILNILGAAHVIRTEDASVALAAKQYGALVVDGKTADGFLDGPHRRMRPESLCRNNAHPP